MAKTTSTNTKEDDKKPWEGRYCRECAHCTPYTRFETLTVKDKKPTLGICPHREFKVLLSERACKEHFKLSSSIK